MWREGYFKLLRHLKPVCALLTAAVWMQEQEGGPLLSFESFTSINQFLGVGAFIKKALLRLVTPNLQGGFLFARDSMLELPSWATPLPVVIDQAPGYFLSPGFLRPD